MIWSSTANELEDARWFTREETAQMLARTHPDGLFTDTRHPWPSPTI